MGKSEYMLINQKENNNTNLRDNTYILNNFLNILAHGWIIQDNI